MINPIISQLQSEIWMMEPRAMTAMFGKLFTIDPESLSSLMKIEIQKSKPAMRIDGGAAVINIHGVLMKNPPSWLAWFGIEATDYNQIRQQLSEAIGSNDVQSILLHVDSPGGTVAGVTETAEAIEAAAAQKSISAYIEDLGASAAYYLTSQAGNISANSNAEVGSIGVYTVYEDYSRAAETAGVKVNIIRSGEHKGMGVLGAQQVIDGMADNFIKAVSSGRKMSIEAVRALADGRVFLAADAKKNGLIDNITNGNKENKIKEKKAMADEKETAATVSSAAVTTVTVDIEAVKKQANENGKVRLSALQAAFPDEPKFAIEQFAAGATVESAKAAFCDVLAARNAELKLKNTELEKGTSSGANPVAAGGEGGSGAGGFMEMAKTYAEENKCSMTIAMQKVKKGNPQVFNTYIKKARQSLVEDSE